MINKPRRFIAVSDSHGDMIDPDSERAVFEFIKDFKPEIRCHLGDAFDFRSLRRGASDEERSEGLEDDWRMGSDFLRKFFDGGKENHFLRGNHDERLWRIEDSTTGLVRDYARDGIKRFNQLMSRCKARVLPYDARLGVLRLGRLKCIHGYAAGVGATAKHARSFGCVIHGHTHVIEVAAVDSDEGPREARAIGALCKIDMPYNSHHLGKLRHSNGFAYGYLFENGDYQIFQARKINGRFYAASDIKVY
jgi:predicted phosphodiesterase